MEAINLDLMLRLQRERRLRLTDICRCQQVDGLRGVGSCSIDGLVLPCGTAASVEAKQ